jgi:hypothetical protein
MGNTVSQLNPVRSRICYVIRICVNILIQSMPTFPNLPLTPGFPDYNSVRIFQFAMSCTCRSVSDPIVLGLITLIVLGEGQTLWSRSLLQRVEPLLCNDREMDGYTRPVSGQRLGKHVPTARKQILNNAIVGL